jgi:hypothetical protein
MELILILLVGVGLLAAYFLPYLLADMRGHANPGMVLLLNFFLGWTIIGWFFVLAIAMLGATKAKEVGHA